MDGRKSACVLFTLVLATSGCITTTEQRTTFPNPGEAPPNTARTAKEDPKQSAPPKLLTAVAELKESDAEKLNNQPEKQARLRDEARQAYQDIIKAEPDNTAAYRGLARIYARMGDYERAQQSYKKALARQPKDVHLWFDLAMMHDRRKEWAEGIRCFRKGLEIDPENQDCLKGLGFTLARAGQFEASITYLTRAMGSAAAAHYNVARMLLHLSEQLPPAERAVNEQHARHHLRLAVQENPELERARELLARFEPAPGQPQGAVAIQFADPGH
jgi:tetratricopeptide (TPR) repeat protein